VFADEQRQGSDTERGPDAPAVHGLLIVLKPLFPVLSHASLRDNLQVGPLQKASQGGVAGASRHSADQGETAPDSKFRSLGQKKRTLALVVDVPVSAGVRLDEQAAIKRPDGALQRVLRQ
jgi:hypothetical protein